MNTSRFLLITYLISTAALLVATWSKITHQEYADSWLLMWMLTTVIFVMLATMQILRSQKISLAEKTMWVLGFIFLTPLTGFIFIFLGGKRLSSKI